ncbi:MAG: ATP-binding cassette domain-containing protein [Propionibacteriaceae bacterium]|nr:ATP-binding cassette domain-containing protein [Propionibacteriaceae bacterium]
MVNGQSGPPVIHVENFKMNFGATQVIKDLSFDVNPGETFGFLGSNGSGKTTTIRALLGIYIPTAGVLQINGRNFEPSQATELGYLPEERGLYKKETVLDTMVYFGRLKGMTPASARTWSLSYLERVGLLDKPKVRLDKLSGGEQQKVQLGVTIMNDPKLLILDEPTKGFDPVNRRLLMSIIEERKQAGATIVIITHQMDDVEKLCDRIILLKDGVKHAYGTVEEVQDEFGGTTIKIEADRKLPASPSYTILADAHGHSEVSLTEGRQASAVLNELIEAGLTVSSFIPGRRSLESIFVSIYGAKEVD